MSQNELIRLIKQTWNETPSEVEDTDESA
jgi:hypothetical protein